MRFRGVVGAGAAAVALLCGATAPGHAEQVAVPDVVRTLITLDGWRLTLTLTEARVDAVPNMASAPLSHEGYISGRVTLSVDGDGGSPVTGGQLVVGAQIGCQVDLSDGLDLGMSLDTDVFDDDSVVGLGPDAGSSLHSGGITTVGFGAKELKGHLATISVLDAHVQADECGGAVTVRIFASARTSTEASDDALNVYGQVLPL